MRNLSRWSVILLLSCGTGCTGMLLEGVTDTVIAVAKIPVKVGAAVVDLITEDDEPEEFK